MSSQPTHIVAAPGDKRSLCGIKDSLPRVWAAFVQAHIDGRNMLVCPECDALWKAGQ